MIQFLTAIFLSAFLLFQIQPIIARYILPWYGGSPAVWTGCMMFFQVALLFGYLYAHLLANRVPSRRQPIVHLSLLALSFLLLPISPPDSWVPTAGGQPAVQILALLSITVGIPFVLLSASAPLLQHWFSGVHPGKSPFRLYALSNLGSLIALLSYPILFEPQFTIDTQANTWSFLYLVLAAVLAWCGITFAKTGGTGDQSAVVTVPAVSALDRVLWVALAACGSTILLAVTNHICQDVAVVPFLWILPLSLYLISFIICFDKDIWYQRGIWITLLVLVLGPLLHLMFQEFSDPWISIFYQVGIYCLALFACCMVCHGELARRRSAVPHLTTFYLYVALGGALGGVFVNLIAPLLFAGFWELHVALAGTVILAGICIGIDKQLLATRRRKVTFSSAWSVASLALIVLLGLQIRTGTVDSIYHGRGFFGVMFVYEWDVGARDHERGFYHGKIQHGRQAMHPSMLHRASSYYGVNSGVAEAMQFHPRRHAAAAAGRGLKVGIVGLGVGTLSMYGTAQDSFRYYEINPQVEMIARRYFKFLKNGNAATEVVLGDARVSMERELLASGSNEFDVLVLDAFSGDSIPVHLLTEEAFDLYAKHLRSDGILAVHITNQYLDLSDIVRAAARRIGKDAIWIEDGADRWYEDENDWILVTNNPLFMQSNRLQTLQSAWDEEDPGPIRWTDDFSNLFQVIDWD
jgi:spermidine synthase